MRLNRRTRDDDIAADDALLPGPIIIVPPSKEPDLPVAAPHAPARDGLARAGYAVGGAVLTLTLTLGVQSWLGRPPAPTAPRAARMAAPAAAMAAPLPGVTVLAVTPAARPDAGPARSADTVSSAGRDDDGSPAPPAVAVRLASSVLEIPASAPAIIGAWYHMDVRTRFADSMVVVLLADGRATALEQRWTLERRGWQPARTTREGRWALGDADGHATELCVTWSRPAAEEACAVVQASSTGMRMEFAGRYWQRAACVEPAVTEPRVPVQVRSTAPARPATGD